MRGKTKRGAIEERKRKAEAICFSDFCAPQFQMKLKVVKGGKDHPVQTSYDTTVFNLKLKLQF